jgi:hypothetical protein
MNRTKYKHTINNNKKINPDKQNKICKYKDLQMCLKYHCRCFDCHI